MATLDTIRARIAKLEAQAASVAAKQSSGVLAKIRDLMEKHGLTLADIEAHVGKKRGRKPNAKSADARSAVAAKYQDPKSGATWSGRGRAPTWIANAKDRSKFEVAGTPSTNVTKVKAAPKAGNYVRGPQPAQYQDPKTGATWSGRGRAPAWIANAKDRTKFLISAANESANTATATEKAVAKKPSARKVAAKKTATKSAPAAKKAGRGRGVAKKAIAQAEPAVTESTAATE
ncbi:H-NS histone family protein [Paraburkholderia tropica]|uniref:H-NS histone family protein n=1 Tax=Paraburkholderia tropica TaxID=92647 RepID=UPI002ABDF2FB|nr:H-NS family nucleoid-associated regulatory protein [Paraburkholderia tropica]